MASADEAERVVQWNLDRFEELGYAKEDAIRLAEAGVGWHELDRLIAAGCPLLVAARIA